MATYTLLRDKSWGIRCNVLVSHGDRVTVTKKDGSSKVETVDKVLWTDNKTYLCSIMHTEKPRSTVSHSNGRCRSCHGPIRNAPHHRAMGGLCGDCAFDEYDM